MTFKDQQLFTNFSIKLSFPTTKTDEYKDKSVNLIGWGAQVNTGAASDSLKRITIRVFSMR